MTVTVPLTQPDPDLENLAVVPPEYILFYAPQWLVCRVRDCSCPGIWALVTTAAYDAQENPPPGWMRRGHAGTPEDELAGWAAGLLGYPVALEPGTVTLRPAGGLLRRTRRDAPLYRVRRNT